MSQQKSRKDNQDGGNLMARLVDLGIPASFMAAHLGARMLSKSAAAKKPAARKPSLNKRIDNAISRGTRKTMGGFGHQVVGNDESLLGAPLAQPAAAAPVAAVNASADAALSAILGHKGGVKKSAAKKSAAKKSAAKK